LILVSILVMFLIVCQPVGLVGQTDSSVAAATGIAIPDSANPEPWIEAFPTASPTSLQEDAPPIEAGPGHIKRTRPPTRTTTELALDEDGASVPSPMPPLALLPTPRLDPEAWQSWPVIPEVPQNARAIYQKGLALGTNPHAFSILGDCQSLSGTFMGVFETNPAMLRNLPPELQSTVTHFRGSFNRRSPTVRGGTTAGAVLWPAWHGNRYSCRASETPLECELRLHNPSIVIINLGTHYETTNITFLRQILDQLIERGIVPILSTKADNSERDYHLNLEMALLAVEYDLPLWNFYAAASDLPNNGVGLRAGRENQGEIYLSYEGLKRHRNTALEALAAVWQAITQP
jgi:hypothetical protein